MTSRNKVKCEGEMKGEEEGGRGGEETNVPPTHASNL